MVDDLLGEFHRIKSDVDESGEHMAGELDSIQAKLKDLEALKFAAAKDSMGDEAATMLMEMQEKLDKVQADLTVL